jgi:hypothetical protein
MQTEQAMINVLGIVATRFNCLIARSGEILQKISITKDSKAPNDANSEPKKPSGFSAAFPGRAFEIADRRAKDPRSDRA